MKVELLNKDGGVIYTGRTDVDGKAYGQMLIAIPEDEMKVARVKNYLNEIHVHVTEIDY